MAENLVTIGKMEEKNDNDLMKASECASLSRRERRKEAKKEKRKKKRKEMAETARVEVEGRLNNPGEQVRLQGEEERERERVEMEVREFEKRERAIQEVWAKKRAVEAEEEDRRRRAWEEEQSKLNQVVCGQETDEDDYEYVEEGPPEIIWQGNEIIVKKKKVRVKKKDSAHQMIKEDADRPTSNPLPPQSEAFADYRSASILSAQEILENVAQQTPNFGTEQDKAHCPFHLKTGACRFGSHCSRIHFYPDKSCTFLIKNMYNGPGLAWEQDEGLEYTDEEVERSYEEFYEDVHTEFLKFGEIVNFKVCRNASSHLRGNVYVHYKTMDSAELAYHSVNGRYFGGKQLQCEFVGVIRWKVAICGEYMKSKLTACSRGITCNFIHCLRNPGGDYEWADWDKPPPRYWVKKMASLFGYSDESGYNKEVEYGSPRLCRNTGRISSHKKDRYHSQSQRSRSRESDYSTSSRNQLERHTRRSDYWVLQRSGDRKQLDFLDKKPYENTSSSRQSYCIEKASNDSDSERYCLGMESTHRHRGSSRKHSRYCNDGKLKSQDGQFDKNTYETSLDTNSFDNDRCNYVHNEHPRKSMKHLDKRSGSQDEGDAGSNGDSSDEDNHNTTGQSMKMKARLLKKLSTSSDDHGIERSRTYSNLSGNLPDGERETEKSSHAYHKKRYDIEELQDKKSPTNSAHKIENFISGDHLGREDEEAGQANTGPDDLGRNYAISGSNSRYQSTKDTSEMGYRDRIKKSKRKSDGSKSRSSDHRVKRSCSLEYQLDKDTDERGRWEPERVSGDLN